MFCKVIYNYLLQNIFKINTNINLKRLNNFLLDHILTSAKHPHIVIFLIGHTFFDLNTYINNKLLFSIMNKLNRTYTNLNTSFYFLYIFY